MTTADIEARERQANMVGAWRGMQNAIRSRLTDADALADAINGPWYGRRDAIQMLAYLGRDDAVLREALYEHEAPAVVDEALKVLVPTPVELIVHRLTMKRGEAATAMRYIVPCGNYLHAEAPILALVAKTPGKLPASILDAFGLAGFRDAVPLLNRYVKIDRLRSYERAIADGDGKKDKPESPVAVQHPDGMWDGPSERALAALVALRRLDAPVDTALVARLRDQIATAMPNTRSSYPHLAHAALSWVLFDAGDDRAFDDVLASQTRHEIERDLVATLLKRDDASRLDRHGAELARCGHSASRNFAHWPVADFFQWQQGDIDISVALGDMYCLSRDAGVAAPGWWTWRCAWARSVHSRRVRGEL